MKSILAHIEKEARRRMVASIEEIASEGFEKAQEEVQGYYDGGSPVQYIRQNKLKGSARRTATLTGGDSASVAIYLTKGLSYQTGSFSGPQVLEATENNSAGTVGKGGFWKRTRRAIPKIVASALSRHFS